MRSTFALSCRKISKFDSFISLIMYLTPFKNSRKNICTLEKLTKQWSRVVVRKSTMKNGCRLCHRFGLINTFLSHCKNQLQLLKTYSTMQFKAFIILLSSLGISSAYRMKVRGVQRMLDEYHKFDAPWKERNWFPIHGLNPNHNGLTTFRPTVRIHIIIHHFKNYMLFRSKPLTETCQVLVKVLPVPWIPTVVTCPRTTFLPEPLVKNQFPNSGVTSITSKMPFHLGISVKSPMELSAFGA